MTCPHCGSDDIGWASEYRGECFGCGGTVLVSPFDGSASYADPRTMRAVRSAEAGARDVFEDAAATD